MAPGWRRVNLREYRYIAEVHTQIYQFKMVLQGIGPMVWQCILMPDRETLAELHRVIQIAFDLNRPAFSGDSVS